MPAPKLSARGTSDRATENRFGSPLERSMTEMVVWKAIGDEAIPDALADGLESQRRFDEAVAVGDIELVRTLAKRLLADWPFLLGAQDHSKRASDGALLITNPARAMTGNAPQAVWAPKRMPPGMEKSY